MHGKGYVHTTLIVSKKVKNLHSNGFNQLLENNFRSLQKLFYKPANHLFLLSMYFAS